MNSLKTFSHFIFIKVKTYFCYWLLFLFCFVFLFFFLRFLSAVGRYFREKSEITEFQVTK